MANCCTAACGYCGACTDEWEPRSVDEPPDFCGHCDGDVGIGAISIAGLGLFCSRACADAEERAFTERMKRRGFMEVQPDLLNR